MRAIGLARAIGVIVATAGCAHGNAPASREGVFSGVLTVQAEAGRSPAFTLDQEGQPCLQLLLTPAIAAIARRLDGRRVLGTGCLRTRPSASSDAISVEVEGRSFSPFLCGGRSDVLLVDALVPRR